MCPWHRWDVVGPFLNITLFIAGEFLNVYRSMLNNHKYVLLVLTYLFITVINYRNVPVENLTVIYGPNLRVAKVYKGFKENNLPSLLNTSISLKEIRTKFKRCTSLALKNNVNCSNIYDSPSQVWRSAYGNGTTRIQDFERMNLASSCCAFYYEDLMKPAPVEELFPWEQDYLSSPYLQRLDDIAWANLSTIHLVSPKGGNVSVTIGSKVTFKIVLFNGRRQRRRVGGDKIEVWLVSDDVKAAIASDVIDNMDGTYTASTLLPWTGSVKVMAAIAHHRELFRTMAYIQRIFKTTHWLTGNFISSSASEATLCSPFTSLPAHSTDQICNLTDAIGLPWYCGRPVKSDKLDCEHFKSVTKLHFPSYLPLTEAEEKLINMTERRRPFLIPNHIVIQVVTDNSTRVVLPLPELKCYDRNLSLTFEDKNSNGFLYRSKWRPLDCRLPDINVDFVEKCLNKTTVIFIGDSNAKKQFKYLTSIVKCAHKIKKKNPQVSWHVQVRRCDDDTNKMSIQFFPHTVPFFPSQDEEIKLEEWYSEIDIINSIPTYGKYVIYIHSFLHLVPFHLSAADHRLRLIREAIHRLLVRNQNVIVVYQSAFSAYDRTPRNKHKMGAFLLELQRNILKGLGDRVMFVLTWPMTVAAANTESHPKISPDLTRYYLGYVCGRM